MTLPIYYVNLAARRDRRDSMEAQFAALGLPAERVEATTPVDIPADLKAKFCDPRRAYWLTEVELACSLSHREVFRRIEASGASHGVLFEDDVVLSVKLAAMLAAFESAGPAIDVLKLEDSLEPLRVAREKPTAFGPIAARRVYSYSSGAAGYVISRKAAQMLMREDWMLEKQTDRVLFNPYEVLVRHGMAMRHADPALCVQKDSGSSDITPSRQDRAARERAVGARRWMHDLREFYFREVHMGARKAWHQHVRGASKRRMPFEG